MIRGAWILCAWLVLNVCYLLFDGFRSPVLPADLAVVLGSKVERDGTPSSGLQRRLERARDLYRKGGVKAILVSGGRGAEGFEEADVMRAVLMRSGVPAEAMLVDRAGNNTRLTAIHARELIEKRGWQSAVVISQYYHVPRAKLALRQEGVPQVSGAAAEYRFAWTDPLSVAREIAGFYVYLVNTSRSSLANRGSVRTDSQRGSRRSQTIQCDLSS